MSTDIPDFESIHETFRPNILRYLTRLVGPSAAEDLTQEVFIKINRGLAAFRGECKLSSWVYRIATNAAMDAMRAPAFRADAQTHSLDEMDTTESANVWTDAETASLEKRLMQKDMFDCFERFCYNLPPNYRTVVVLSMIEQLTNDEIAEILGLKLDVVKIRLHRGRARLIQELKRHCKPEDWL